MKLASAVGLLVAVGYCFLPSSLFHTSYLPTYYNRVLFLMWMIPLFLKYWGVKAIHYLRKTPFVFRLLIIMALLALVGADVRSSNLRSPFVWFDACALLSWVEVFVAKWENTSCGSAP